jgi:hypothetical protein
VRDRPTIVDPKTVRPNQIRGPRIEGGQTSLNWGDLVDTSQKLETLLQQGHESTGLRERDGGWIVETAGVPFLDLEM